MIPFPASDVYFCTSSHPARSIRLLKDWSIYHYSYIYHFMESRLFWCYIRLSINIWHHFNRLSSKNFKRFIFGCTKLMSAFESQSFAQFLMDSLSTQSYLHLHSFSNRLIYSLIIRLRCYRYLRICYFADSAMFLASYKIC